ncbi:MAG: tRNA pseudouridine(13) synthase TruD, partial [Candidatus Thorarchaeota archaeon]
KSQKIRKKLRNSDHYEKLIEKIPKSLNYERVLIKSIVDYPENYERAIKKLPVYLLKLLISSFQSYIFNKLITLRVKKGYSLFQPEIGDVICILDDENGHLTKVKYQYGGPFDTFLEEAISLNRARIVVPLIGFDTNIEDFPLFNELLGGLFIQENIIPSIFENPLLLDFNFTGTYRSMMARPFGLELLEFGIDDVFKNKNKLRLEFSLKKGSYATMLLRELKK